MTHTMSPTVVGPAAEGARPGALARVDVLITGGGTGGHVYPALAIAGALESAGISRERLMFVGSSRGLEADAVPEAGYAIELLPGRGFQRRLTPRALADNFGALRSTISAVWRAWRIVGARRPSIVVGVGGYASVPCIVAARLRRVPVIVHEQNAAPGLANRLAVRLGAHAAISLPGTPLKGAELTGNPVRAVIASTRRQVDRTSRPLVVITGGSLGAKRLNDAALDLYDRWRDRSDVGIVHIAGRRNIDGCVASLDALRRPGDRLSYELKAYEDQMQRWYASASVMCCRAGAVTVAELAAVGMPAVLVPLPGAPGDHQTRNAEALVAAGAALVLTDGQCDGGRLATELDALLAAPDRLDAMSEAGRAAARPDAADRVARLVLATMNGRGR